MSPLRAPVEVEEFWDDLLAFIEERLVIPVVGAELLTVDDDGQPVPLYRAAGERLLRKYRPAGAADVVLREHFELNDAVCALVAAGRRVKDLYRPIHDILEDLTAQQVELPEPLLQLAEIRHFDLFATVTPDTLLARALDAIRFRGERRTAEIEYAPALPTGRRHDIPELRAADYTSVFYLFGRSAVSPIYAIHEEDALEFAFTLQDTLQNGVPPARMFSELRRRPLLLVGCNFPGWLSRFFLRVANEKRLSSDERAKQEFLVDSGVGEDGSLTVFLERFSRDSRWYPIAARDFVAELHRRWTARNPHVADTVPSNHEPRPSPGRCDSIFISYANEDIAAARTLCEAVRQIGGNIVWLDKSALKPGDEWDRHIEGAIQRCHLFLPLISANTERRTEGYFRLEWDEAARRSRMIQGRRFILPIVIDPQVGSGMSAYELVPPTFRALHYSHAPEGRMEADLRATLVEHLRDSRRGRAS
jgi:hypothetical protein